MTEYLLVGITFAFAAAVQPGPLQAYLLSATMAHGWKRTLPAAGSPLLTDGPIAVVVLLLLRQVPPGFQAMMRVAGGMLLIYLAWAAFGEWRRGVSELKENDAHPASTFLQAAAVNILNPNPYLGWSLVLGPLVLRAWGTHPAHAIVLLVSFYGTMVIMLAATIVVFGTVRKFGARVSRPLLLASAAALLAIGTYQLVAAVLGTRPA